MRPKTALGVSGFQCRNEIARLLDPIFEHVDVMILGDGKYPAFNWPYDYSTDGWLEFAWERYPNALTYKLAGEQIDKRNKYLDIAAEEGCEFVIVLDSDEFIHSHKNLPSQPNWPVFYDRLTKLAKAFPEENLFQMYAFIPSLSDWDRAGNVSVPNTYQAYVRIIKNPGEVKYTMNHHSLIKRDAQPHEWLTSWIVVDGVRFSMDSKLRNSEFLQSREKWAAKQYDEEEMRLYHYLQDNIEVQRQLETSLLK